MVNGVVVEKECEMNTIILIELIVLVFLQTGQFNLFPIIITALLSSEVNHDNIMCCSPKIYIVALIRL